MQLRRKHDALLFLLLLFGVLSGCVKSEVSEVPKDAIVVDVRTPKEYAQWHYPGAINIPVDEIESRVEELGDQDQKIVVYCRSGHRSRTAKKKLIEHGFAETLNGGSKSHMKKLAPR
ncbi:MAG: rhodanese-like domain-containing protein [Myxococcota bacterium]|nr:rhodanese-like domain-containing protein [Myxococcota bacterium]